MTKTPELKILVFGGLRARFKLFRLFWTDVEIVANERYRLFKLLR